MIGSLDSIRNIGLLVQPGVVLVMALCIMCVIIGVVSKIVRLLILTPFIRRRIMPISQWIKYKMNFSTCSSILLIVAVCLAFYLGFLASFESDIHDGINNKYATSILYGVQTVLGILDGDSEKLEKLPESLSLLGWLVSWVIPILTVSTAASMLIGFIPRPLPSKKEYLIFSQLEENSLLLAENMMQVKNKKNVSVRNDRMVIFLRIDDKDKLSPEFEKRMGKIDAKVFPYTEADLLRIHWRLKSKVLRFFFLSADTELNFSQMQALLQEAKDDMLFREQHWFGNFYKKERQGVFQQELYLLSEAESAPMLIDHLRKQLSIKSTDAQKECVRLPVFAHTELRLLDRYRTVMYALLQERPLYETADNGDIRVLILGFGKVGKSFYRAAVSLCSMMGYSTTFCIRDKDIDRQWELLELEYPHCKMGVSLDSQAMDVESLSILDIIKQAECKKEPFTYIILSLGDDERNIKVASRLARYYRQKLWEQPRIGLPIICVNLENKIRSDYVSEFFKNDDPCIPLYVFGTDNKTFSEDMLITRSLWNAARKLHNGLRGQDESHLVYWSEYERRSSIASAAHASYCVVSMKPYMGNHSYDEAYKRLRESVKTEMIKAEHNRWRYYSQCEGMREISRKTAKKILKEKQHHADSVAQLTPCMIDMEELEQLYYDLYPDNEKENKKRMKEGKPPHRTFVERDRFVVSNAGRLQAIISEKGENIELKGYEFIVDRKK